MEQLPTQQLQQQTEKQEHQELQQQSVQLQSKPQEEMKSQVANQEPDQKSEDKTKNENNDKQEEKIENSLSQLNLSESNLQIPNGNLVGRRVIVVDQVATIKYHGPLVHEGKPDGSDKQQWLGLEWDDITRGRHNGTVKGHVYFTTKDNQASGSLIKIEKVNFGNNILDAIIKKYFKDSITDSQKQQLMCTILNGVTDSSPKKQEEIKQNAKILIETDENAYFETGLRKKKMVEFYGFDKIWEKINNMKELKEISLSQLGISNIGEEGFFQKVLPNLKVLSLEGNLLYDWNQVFQIGHELKQLEELSVADNMLQECPEIDNQPKIFCQTTQLFIERSPISVFKNLKSLVLININLTWKTVCNLLPSIPQAEELILCKNNMKDVQNINVKANDLQNLVFLNLEQTALENFQCIKPFGKLPKLEKLIMNKNLLKGLGKFSDFSHIKFVSLEGNMIENPNIFGELAQFTELAYLNIKHNPIGDKLSKSYVRQRAVAENSKLQIINGSNLKKYERKDCEIFYLRKTFDEYFQLFNKVYYDFDFEDFKQWAAINHPRIDYLLKTYGNPYEQQPKDETQNKQEIEQKNIMIPLQIVIAAGPMLGKPPLNKKFPDNTTIITLKNVLSKLIQIPANEQLIYYKVNPNDPMEILDEDHKTLTFYGIKEGSEIIVNSNKE